MNVMLCCSTFFMLAQLHKIQTCYSAMHSNYDIDCICTEDALKGKIYIDYWLLIFFTFHISLFRIFLLLKGSLKSRFRFVFSDFNGSACVVESTKYRSYKKLDASNSSADLTFRANSQLVHCSVLSSSHPSLKLAPASYTWSLTELDKWSKKTNKQKEAGLFR